MDSNRTLIVANCWFSLAIIASVYMVTFADKLSNMFFGVLIPIGLVVLVGAIVVFVLVGDPK